MGLHHHAGPCAWPIEVSMPALSMEKRGNVCFFGIDIHGDGGRSVRTMHRFSEFFELCIALNLSANPFRPNFREAPFPRKTWRACTAQDYRLGELLSKVGCNMFWPIHAPKAL